MAVTAVSPIAIAAITLSPIATVIAAASLANVTKPSPGIRSVVPAPVTNPAPGRRSVATSTDRHFRVDVEISASGDAGYANSHASAILSCLTNGSRDREFLHVIS